MYGEKRWAWRSKRGGWRAAVLLELLVPSARISWDWPTPALPPRPPLKSREFLLMSGGEWWQWGVSDRDD